MVPPQNCVLTLLRPHYRELLTKHGALWMRKFPVVEVEDLVIFLQNLDDNLKPMKYIGGTGPRKHVSEMVRRISF